MAVIERIRSPEPTQVVADVPHELRSVVTHHLAITETLRRLASPDLSEAHVKASTHVLDTLTHSTLTSITEFLSARITTYEPLSEDKLKNVTATALTGRVELWKVGYFREQTEAALKSLELPSSVNRDDVCLQSDLDKAFYFLDGKASLFSHTGIDPKEMGLSEEVSEAIHQKDHDIVAAQAFLRKAG